MTKFNNESIKMQQAKAYAEQKQYETAVTDDYLDGVISEQLLNEVMAQSDFMLENLISQGHTRADLVRVAGL